MNTETKTEITPDAARERANREYGQARGALMEAERNYNVERSLAAARLLVIAHENLDRASKAWSSPFPEWHYSR